MPPEISIIIPACNEEQYLEKTVESLKNQTFQDFEAIIVTNGCTDATEELVKKHLAPQIRHLSLPRPNVSVARNAGALNAQGNLLLFLDADTTLSANALQQIQEHFTPDYSVVALKSTPDKMRLKFRMMLWAKNFAMKIKLYKSCSGALLCRKDFFQEVGGYDPQRSVYEHRHLIQKLKHKGRYGYLPATVTTSMRRYQRWGLRKVCFFWIKQWVKDLVGKINGTDYEKVR